MKYQIYQTDNRDYIFMGFQFAMKYGFKRADYEEKYAGEIESDAPIGAILDQVFIRHNRDDRPCGQTMRSLSISDVVVLEGKPYYCDSWGWSEIPGERW